MSKRISIGVIGIGFGQHVHVPAFRADPRCIVGAICASRLDRAQEVARRLEIPKAYGKAADLLADPGIDAVSIAVPPRAQPKMIEAAARAGKHVFCEKPVGATLQTATAALNAVRAANVVSAVDFIFPENAAWLAAKRVLKSGELGRLRHAAVTWRVETRAYQTQLESWKTRESDGGGTLLNLVPHSAYYIEWLFGRTRSLAGWLRGIRPEAQVDSGVDAFMKMDDLEVTMSVSGDAPVGTTHRIEVYGENGRLVLQNETADYVNGFELFVGTRADGALIQRLAAQKLETDGRFESAAKIAVRFLDAIIDGSPMTPSLEHGVRAQALLDAMRESSRRRQWVET